ncbi:MAG: M28 family peptidase [Bacteroidia bacterium]|nr:M28 family peptidase [Bacteroidia bacterium]
MNKNILTETVKKHLQVLCEQIGERRVGSAENRRATDYAQKVLSDLGWETTATELSVIDWSTGGAALTCGNQSFEVFSSHYALGCRAKGELLAIDTIGRLEQTDMTDKIILLHGEIAAEQIAPKKFPFWNPQEHQHLISVLEKGKPLALVTATSRNAALAGGVYPFPLFEDGDFDIPSVFMKDTEGEKLLACSGKTVELTSLAKRIPETAYNVIARKGDAAKNKIVVTAHIDTKINTPGAIDNATGVAIVLALAEIWKNYSHPIPLELVFFNGEDYYGAPGQVKYTEQNAGKFNKILLNINIDGAGYQEGLSCFSAFNLPPTIATALQNVLSNTPAIAEGLPWYQGDHSLFLQNGCAAIAVSSQWFIENMETQELTHTPQDNLSIVNPERVAECVAGIAELVEAIATGS